MRTWVSRWPSPSMTFLQQVVRQRSRRARRPAGRRRSRSPRPRRSRSAGSGRRRARAAARSAGWWASRPAPRGRPAPSLRHRTPRSPARESQSPRARRAGRCSSAQHLGASGPSARAPWPPRPARGRRAAVRPAATSPISRSAAVRNGAQVPRLDAVCREGGGRVRDRQGRRREVPARVGAQQAEGLEGLERSAVEPGWRRASSARSAAACAARRGRRRRRDVGVAHRRRDRRPGSAVGASPGVRPRSIASRASLMTFSGQNWSRWAAQHVAQPVDVAGAVVR